MLAAFCFEKKKHIELFDSAEYVGGLLVQTLGM
jgi:hypothetical protein